MSRWIWSDERRSWVEPAEFYAAKYQGIARSSMPRPYIVSDHLPDVFNHADCKTYDSKSGYYAAVKAAGCEIVGNDSSLREPKAPDNTPKGIEQDLSDAYDQVEAASNR